MKVRRVKPRSQSALAPPPGWGVETVPFDGATTLVTLEDPSAGSDGARNAFARLRPPEGHPPAETQSWRDSVAAVAKAVKVVPQPRRRGIPTEERRPVGAGIREEATAIAAATGDPAVVGLTEKILSGVEGR